MDLINRQAAIDALKGLEFCQYMEFGEYISEDTREVRLIRAEKAQDALQKLPSAQPEIVRCKDCRWHETDINQCGRQVCAVMYDDDFCSLAERKEGTGK